MIFGACVCVLLKVFSLSDAAVSASGSAGVCRRSVLRSLLLNGVDWGPSVWHRWWRIPLSFQKQHSGVSMTYRLLSVCVPWFHCSSFHRKLIFFNVNRWSALSTPKLMLLWAGVFQLVIPLAKSLPTGKVPTFLPSCLSATPCACRTMPSKGSWVMSRDYHQSQEEVFDNYAILTC